jgi:cytosine/adenosine deaminase-related metal-dependent hydrolase
VPLAIGTDQHVFLDPFLEAQRLEFDQRLRTSRRSVFSAGELVFALTAAGYRSIGWDQGGTIATGSFCDLTTVRIDTPRSAASLDDQKPLVLAGSDVDTVIVGGRTIVSAGQHHQLENVARELSVELERLWD